MNKQIALSIEQMNHLKELGVDTSDASLCWIKEPNTDNYSLSIHDESCYEMSCLHPVPAFTLQDILEKLPNIIDVDENECNLNIFFHEDGISVYYEDFYQNQPAFFCQENLLDTVYEMLCWVAENYPEFLKGGNR